MSNRVDLRQFAIDEGGDPQTFFVGSDLSNTDLRSQDLRGMLFNGCDVNETTLISPTTKFDATFIGLFAQARILPDDPGKRGFSKGSFVLRSAPQP